MKTPDELKVDAMAAIQALRTIAVHGDEQEATQATDALLEITRKGISQVESLAMHPDNRHAPAALIRSAASASSWPVWVPVVEELRENAIKAQLPASFGDEAPIRTTKKKRGAPRKFDPHANAGFALSVASDLMADGEFPLTGDPDDILHACFEKLEEDSQGDWDRFPLPPKLREDAEADHRSLESTVRKWLKNGLKSLCK